MRPTSRAEIPDHLAEQAASGDAEAWGQIHALMAHRIAAFLTVSRLAAHDDDAYDFVATAFLRAVEGRWTPPADDSTSIGKALRGFLFRVAMNQAKDYRRRPVNQDRCHMALEYLDITGVHDEADIPSTDAIESAEERADIIARVQGVLADMPIEYSAPLRLQMSGLGLAEIGTALGLSHQCIKSRCYRGRMAFRARWVRLYGEWRDAA